MIEKLLLSMEIIPTKIKRNTGVDHTFVMMMSDHTIEECVVDHTREDLDRPDEVEILIVLSEEIMITLGNLKKVVK